jgi:hypothetical protein
MTPETSQETGPENSIQIDPILARYVIKSRKNALTLLQFRDFPKTRHEVRTRVELMQEALAQFVMDERMKKRLEEHIITARNILFRFLMPDEEPHRRRRRRRGKRRRKQPPFSNSSDESVIPE